MLGKVATGIGKFYLLEKLGRGGMGTVFKVRDPKGQILALKLLDRQSSEFSHRFKREFRVAADLQHPNIVRVFDLCEQPDLFFTMEFVEGSNLRYFVQGQKFRPATDPATVRKIFFALGQVIRALDYIHARGIVHRDLKPDNIRVDLDGNVKLTDFGLARLEGAGSEATFSGRAPGTVGFVPPEQILGLAADVRTDLYALGVILYLLLTGEMPHKGETDLDVMKATLEGRSPVPVHEVNPTLDPRWSAMVQRLIQRRPDDRYPGIPEMSGDLRDLWSAIGPKGKGPILDSGGLQTQQRRKLTLSQLVGRQVELERLVRELDRVCQHGGAVTFVEGEGGIGKTRLVEEVRAVARAKRVLVLVGKAPMSVVPYGHFRNALDQVADWLVGQPAERVASMVTREWAALKTIAPRLNQIDAIRELVAPAPLPPREQRFRELAALTGLFRTLLATHQLLLVIEDLHRVDDGSANVMSQIVTQLIDREPELRLFLVVTSRPREVPEGSAAARFRATVRPSVELRLAPLDEEQVANMVASMTGGGRPDREVVRRLLKSSDGNPFVLEQAMKRLVAVGAVAYKDGRWVVDADAVTKTLRPRSPLGDGGPGLSNAVVDQLERLRPQTRRVVEAVAIAGESARPEILASAVDLSEIDALIALDEGMRAGLLDEPSRDGEPYVFKHHRQRDATFAVLTAERRRQIHLRIGAALELGSAAAPPVEELARHFDLGGNLDKSLEYLPLAGRLYAERFENALALQVFDRSARLLRSRNLAPPASVCLRAGRVAELMGRYEAARDWSRLALAEASGEERREEMAEALNLESHVLWLGTRYADAEAAANEALSLSVRARSKRQQARALGNLGRIARRLEQFERAEEYFFAAAGIERELGDQLAEAETLCNLSMVARKRDRHDEARTLVTRGLELFRIHEDLRGTALALSQAGAAAVAVADYAEGRTLVRQALDIDREVGNRRGVGLDLSSLGSIALLVGEYHEARSRFDEALGIFREVGDPQNEGRALINLGHVEFRDGGPVAACDYYEKAHNILAALGDKGGCAETLSALAAAELLLDYRDSATEHARQAVTLAREVGLREKEAWAQLTLARATDDLEAAEQAVKLAERTGDRNLCFQAMHCAALVMRSHGLDERSRVALEAAATVIEGLVQALGEAARPYLQKAAVREVYRDLDRPLPKLAPAD